MSRAKWINNTISNEKYNLSLKCFNDNNDLRLDKKAEKEYCSHPAVFIRNETFPWRIQPPLKQVRSRATCQEMIWTWKKIWWKGSIEMSRLVKIDLVTCEGFKQKSLCSEKTVCISGVHWNFFSSREVIWTTRTGYNSSVCVYLLKLSCHVTPTFLLLHIYLMHDT